ncbi:ATP-grasp domain-containing protein [bacterium]|nr:ATP-grasp domain-containing protein [bacterium]
MIILEKPYVSDFLIETIKKNNYSVLENEISKELLPNSFLISKEQAIEAYKNGENFYTNSENSISWIGENLPSSQLNQYIEISKNKALFRKKTQSIYPSYKFFEVSLEEINKLENLTFPFILKPTVGFLSFGVYPVYNEQDWKNVLSKLKEDIERLKNIFPKNVVDMTNFIIEDMIEGDEYALDVYFDNEAKANILNIYKHPFLNSKDVSDRLYYTSKAIIEQYLESFEELLNKISNCCGFKNFPCHIELRVDNNKAIPIEINPLRFCGWCITDITKYAWNFNIYEYYFEKKRPDWKNILKNKGDEKYYFTIADLPKGKIKSVNYEKYLKNISNPLCIRKIDYTKNPIFAIVFAKTNSNDEIKNLLEMNTEQFCTFF